MAFDFIAPQTIIERLRDKMPTFADRVAGGSQFDVFEDDTQIPKPACFVMLGNNTTDTLSIFTGIQQRIQHSFDIVIYLDAVDIRKQEPEDLSVAFKRDLIKYLNGWKPTTSTHCSPLEFVGDQLHETSPDTYARIYQFTQTVDFNSSLDGEGDIGDINDLPDFDTLIGPILVGDGDTADVDVKMENIHE